MPRPRASDSRAITALALRTLEDALARAECGLPRRTWGDRMALSWLVREGIAEAWQAKLAWEALGDEAPGQRWEQDAAYITTTLLCGSLDRWHRIAGLPCPGMLERAHRARLYASDLDPRPGTAQHPCMCNRYTPGERETITRHFGAHAPRRAHSAVAGSR